MPEKSRGKFLESQSTRFVIVLRCLIIVFTHCVTVEHMVIKEWMHSDALSSVLMKPILSLAHVREAQAIQKLTDGRLSSVYSANQTIHLPPLLLALLKPLLDFSNPDLLLAIALLVVDLLISYMMETVGQKFLLSKRTQAMIEEEQEQAKLPDVIKPQNDHIFPINLESKPIIPIESLPLLAAMAYFFSPVCTISANVYGCFQNIPAFLLMAALHEFLKEGGSDMQLALFLALASYIHPHYCVFLVPFILLQFEKQFESNTYKKALLVLYFLLWSTTLQWLSFRLVGQEVYWSVLEASYGCGWNTIGPSLSVQWYLYIQLFSRFRDYFSTILLGLPWLLVAPLTVRLHKYPMVMVAILSTVWTVFAPVQTLFDMNFSMVFFLLSPKSLARMGKASLIAIWSIMVPVILNVVDQWMWFEANTGNANYVFFQSLGYNVFVCIILAEFCSASLQRDKALRLAAKERATKTLDEKVQMEKVQS